MLRVDKEQVLQAQMLIYILHFKPSYIMGCNVCRHVDMRPLALLDWPSFSEHLSWRISRNLPLCFASVGCLLSGYIEATLPENTDEKNVCLFQTHQGGKAGW